MYLIASLERGEEAIFHNPVLRRPGEVLVHHGGEVHGLEFWKSGQRNRVFTTVKGFILHLQL